MATAVKSVTLQLADGTAKANITDATLVKAGQTYLDGVTPVVPPTPPIPSGAIAVGPTRAVKTLPKDLDGHYVLDAGVYAIDPAAQVAKGKTAIIESLDTAHWAMLSLPACFTKTPTAGPDCGSPAREGTIQVSGSLTLKNLKTTGTIDAILLGSQPGSVIDASNVVMDNGGFWRGSGATSATYKGCYSTGKPRAYLFANFTNNVGSCVIDTTGCPALKQGGEMVGVQAQGETVIRVMDCSHLQLIGVTTTPWLYNGKDEWKQDVQFRPTSGLLEAINCHFYMPDIGDMTWRNPPQEIQEVRFTNCVIDKEPHVTAGCKKITYINTKVAGKLKT